MSKLKFKFKDKDGTIQNRWIDKDEWDFMESFRHQKEMFFWQFGCRAVGLGPKVTEEESKLFFEWYSEKYPEHMRILNKTNNNA